MKNEKDKLIKNNAETNPAQTTESGAEKSPKKNRKPQRWTAVDTVILFMLLLAIGGILLRGFLPEGSADSAGEDAMSGPYYVEFSVAEIRPSVLAEISAFDPLYLYESGELLGYVGVYDDGSIALHTVTPVANSAGTAVAAEGCMVCLEGIYRDGSLLVKGMDSYLAPGSTLVLRTDRAVLTVEITAIRMPE